MSEDSQLPPGAAKRAKPESLRARSLSVSLTARNLKKSLEWYRDVVGFTVDEESEHEGVLRSVRLKAGDVRIRLNQDDGAKGFGGRLLSQPADMPWGVRMFRLQDPDGFKFAISSET